jgi:hypothetical protein
MTTYTRLYTVCPFNPSFAHLSGSDKPPSGGGKYSTICALVLGQVTQDRAGAWESKRGTHDGIGLRSMQDLCLPRDKSGRVIKPQKDAVDDWTSLFPSNECARCATVDVPHRCKDPLIVVDEERAILKDSRGTYDRHPVS